MRIKPGRRRRSHILVMLLTSILAATAGCGLVPGKLQVAPSVLAEIRSIGKVVAAGEEEVELDGGPDDWPEPTQILYSIVLDVHGHDAADSMRKATALLRGRGWHVTKENVPAIASMESAKWEKVDVNIRPFYRDYYKNAPAILSAVDASNSGPGALLDVMVSQSP